MKELREINVNQAHYIACELLTAYQNVKKVCISSAKFMTQCADSIHSTEHRSIPTRLLRRCLLAVDRHRSSHRPLYPPPTSIPARRRASNHVRLPSLFFF